MSTPSKLRKFFDGFRKTTPSRREPARPIAEVLESRRLMTITVANFTFNNQGEGGADAIGGVNWNATSDGAFMDWTVDWGDSSGIETESFYSTYATHSYSGDDEGTSYNVYVSLFDEYSTAGMTAVATSSFMTSGTCAITDATLEPTTSDTFTLTLGQLDDGVLGAGVLGYFDDHYAGDDGSAYTALIDWGDGSTDWGVLDSDGPHAIHDVAGAHLYTNPGTFNGTINVVDEGSASCNISFAVDVVLKPIHTCACPTCDDPNAVIIDPSVAAPIPSPTSDGFGASAMQAAGPGLRPTLSIDSGLASAAGTMQYTDGPAVVNEAQGNLGDDAYGLGLNVSASLAHLVRADDGGNIYGVASGSSVLWFDDLGGGSFSERYMYGDKLTYDSGNHQYVFTSYTGAQTTFYDYNQGGLSGLIKGATDPNGNSTTVSYNGSDQLTETLETNTTGTVVTKQSFVYSYSGGLVSNILLRRKTYDTSLGQSDGSVGYTNVRQVAYAYYTTGDANGNTGDLKTATTEDGGGSTIDVSYYRYWLSGQAAGGAFGTRVAKRGRPKKTRGAFAEVVLSSASANFRTAPRSRRALSAAFKFAWAAARRSRRWACAWATCSANSAAVTSLIANFICASISMRRSSICRARRTT